MIRRPPSLPRLAAVLALLALAAGARLRAGEEAPPGHATAPALPPPPEPATRVAPPSAPPPAAPKSAAGPFAPPRETAPAHGPAPASTAPHPSAPSPGAAPAVTPKPPAPPAHAAATADTPPPAARRAGAPVRATVTTDEIQGLIKLGTRLTDRGDYDSAEIAYYQVLNNPAAPVADIKTALLCLGRMQRKQGALTKAAAIYERFLKDYPGDDRTPDALLDLGRTLRSLGVYKSAIARFYAVINSTLKLPSEGFERYQVLTKTAQFEIAETHFQSGDFAEAAKFYTRLRLLDLAPGDRARAHFKAAYSLRLKGDLEGAVSALRAYIDQWPDDENLPEGRYLLAITLRELKRPDEAFAATLELLRTEQTRVAQDPKRWAYWQRRTGNQLANDFFESGNILNAQTIYSGLVDLSPEPAWRLPLTYQIALCHERLGTIDRARTAYQTIVDAIGPTPPVELAELTRMAAWHLAHLTWRDGVAQQVTAFFDTTTGRPAAPAADPAHPPGAAPAASRPTAPAAVTGVKTASTP